MPLWGKTDNAANSVKFGSALVLNAANQTALYNNTTPNAIIPKEVVGVFGVDITEEANNNADTSRAQHAGWQLRTVLTGDITAINVTGAGSGFANGETVQIGNGTMVALGKITTNATANMVSVTVVQSGAGWVNATMANSAFWREKSLRNITVGGTPTGYSNTDTIVASNGTVNATASIVTNATGGFATGNVTITNVGLWANNKANADVTFTVVAANGAASAGSGATFTANIAASTGGSVSVTVSPRAGRIQYETLVAMGTIA